MTAVLPGWDIAGRSDAELAGAAMAGDRGAFARIYDRYADRLHDFCAGMLRDRDAAADCVQEVFCTAATQLPSLREPDKLRPWLYAIARNEALRHLRERRNERLYEEVPDMVSRDAGPDTLAARTELADLIAQAAGGLSDRDRSVLELAYRHGLTGPELAEALGVSPATANTLVHRLRETIERSLGALLVARRARTNPNRCAGLGEILAGWDGTLTILMRKRIARHIESCPRCEAERRRLVNPVALLGSAPVFIPAPGWLRARTLRHIQLTSCTTGFSPPRDDGSNRAIRQSAGRVALGAATLITSLGLTLGWLLYQNTPITPTGLSTTPPPPATPTPVGSFTTEPTPTTASPAPAPAISTVPAVAASPSQPSAPVQPSAPATPTLAPTAPSTPVVTPTIPMAVPPVLIPVISLPRWPIFPPPPPPPCRQLRICAPNIQ